MKTESDMMPYMGFATIGRFAVDIRNCIIPGATCHQIQVFLIIKRCSSYTYSKNQTNHYSLHIIYIDKETHKDFRQRWEAKAVNLGKFLQAHFWVYINTMS
jgi:hypothetical protein